MAYKIANIKWLRDQGWSISSSYASDLCPTYNEIVNEIPKGSTTVNVNGTCIATSKAYANNQLVCESDITIGQAVDCSTYNFDDLTPQMAHTAFERIPIAQSNYNKEQLSWTINDNWITDVAVSSYEPAPGAICWRYGISVVANPTTDERNGSVTFTSTDGCSFTGHCTQAGQPPVDCSVYNFTTSTSIIDPMSGNIPIAHSSHLNNLEQLSYAIKDGGGFLTGITAYTIYEDEREWEYRGYFNTTTSSSDRTATIEYKNGDGTCVFKQELVMKGGSINLATLTLDNGSTVDIEGNGELTEAMIDPYETTITKAEIKNTCTSIGNYALSGCTSLTSVTIPNSVTRIGKCAFAHCTSLTNVTIPSSVATIANGTLSRCTSLTSVTIPNSVTRIGNAAFELCHLTSITIPNSVVDINIHAFGECYFLTSVTMSNTITSIGDTAFVNCHGLTSITLPSSIENIGRSAFAGCRSVTSITCNATTPPSLGIDAFDATRGRIFVPSASVEAYKSASGWSTYKQRITAIQ